MVAMGNRFLRTACMQFSVLLLLVSVPTAASDYDHTPTVGPAKGWLVIAGGGLVGPEIKERFVELAGGPDADFVLIPTALDEEEINFAEAVHIAKGFGITHITVLHTRDRKEANSQGFVKALRKASAVWIEGGEQWRLADAYIGTAVEREIKALLARGGVVGGSSAGAIIQGSYLVRGAPPASPDNPDGDHSIVMAPGHETGFALLANSAIDPHVIQRHRENDLAPVIASHPKLLGIGIDQETAIVVHGDTFEVIGDSKVIIHDGKKPFYFLSHGQKFNLKTRLPE
jgi:cyanophycinase